MKKKTGIPRYLMDILHPSDKKKCSLWNSLYIILHQHLVSDESEREREVDSHKIKQKEKSRTRWCWETMEDTARENSSMPDPILKYM